MAFKFDYLPKENYYVSALEFRVSDPRYESYPKLKKRFHQSMTKSNRRWTRQLIEFRIAELLEKIADANVSIRKYRNMLCGHLIRDSYYLGRIAPFEKTIVEANKEIDQFCRDKMGTYSATIILGIRKYRTSILDVHPKEIIVEIALKIIL